MSLDSGTLRPQASRVRFWLALLLVSMTAVSAAAETEIVEKWRTPAGTLHFGRRPPAGSVLLERIELAAVEEARPKLETAALPAPAGGLADAARDGREIMRQRAAEREAERERDLARELRDREVVESAPVPSLLVVSNGVSGRRHRRHGDDFHPRLGIGPSPIRGPFQMNPMLVSPSESLSRVGPSAPARFRPHRP